MISRKLDTNLLEKLDGLEYQVAQPIPLVDGDKKNLIYTADGLDSWWDIPGVYMFARVFNKEISPLYIGKAENIGQRVWQHFKSNTKLMTSIKKSANGTP